MDDEPLPSALKQPDVARLHRINELLKTGLALPTEARAAWLDDLPPDQRDLALSLRPLLMRAAVETESFLRHPAEVLAGALGLDADAPDQPGKLVGPYRLIRELGTGGMATVWLAERTDGSLRRQVALKLPKVAWGPSLAKRMLRERDILSALEHPLIARLYDAGITDTGRPWLAMEHVSGTPIDAHCHELRLHVPAKLRLFMQVAEAVSYAHAHLVVHRDLKPSNILVTHEGEVRLLDFGVAKLIDQDHPVAPDLTQFLGRAATPEYSSPEQILGQPISTASDVYSLGVVLYELLTNERPYRLDRQSAAALEEAILSANVPLASTRCSDRRMARLLQGDLDTLLGKALSKDPAHRYSSVESMALDVQRYLEGKPILAQPPSRYYRFKKFVSRNRLALASASMVLMAISAGLVIALWQAGVARAETARTGQVKQFVASIFEQAVPRDGIGGAPSAIDLLTSATERIERELSTQPRVAAELGVIVGRGFSALGEPQKGLAALRAAVPRAEVEFGRSNPLTLQGKLLLAESLEMQDLATAERLLAQTMPDVLAGLPATAPEAVVALRRQSFMLARRNDEDRAYAALKRAIEIGDRHLGPQAEDTIEAIGLLSNTYGRFHKFAEQLRTAAEAERRAVAAFGSKRPHSLLVAVDRWYADALRNNDRPADAVPVLRRVLKDQLALDTTKTPRVRAAMLSLALALARVGRLDEALAHSAEALALEAAQNPVDSDDRVGYGANHAHLLMQARRTDEAWTLHQRISEIERHLGGRSEAGMVGDYIRESRLLAMRGDGERAGRAALQAVSEAEKHAKQYVPEAWLAASFNARMQRNASLAVEYARRAAQAAGALPYRVGVAALVAGELGCALLDAGATEDATVALSEASQAFANAQVEPSIRMADSLVCQARLALQKGSPTIAEQLLRPLLLSWESTSPGSEWHGETLLWLTRAQLMNGTAAPKLREQRERALAMLSAAREPALRELAVDAR